MLPKVRAILSPLMETRCSDLETTLSLIAMPVWSPGYASAYPDSEAISSGQKTFITISSRARGGVPPRSPGVFATGHYGRSSSRMSDPVVSSGHRLSPSCMEPPSHHGVAPPNSREGVDRAASDGPEP